MGFEARNLVTAFGEQADKTTEAASLTALLAKSNSLERQISTIKSEALRGNRFSAAQYVSQQMCGGSIENEVSEQTLPLIIKHAIGPEPEDPTDLGAGSGPYKHIFVPDQNTMDLWLTFLKYFKGAAYYEKFTGCKINQMTFNLTGQSIISYTLDILGISSSKTEGTPADPTANAGDQLFSWDTDTITWDVGVGDTALFSIIDNFSFVHNNNLGGDDFGLGRTRRTLDAGESTHTVSMTAQFDTSIYSDMQGKMYEGAEVAFEVNIGSANGGNDPYLKISYPKLVLTSAPAAVSGPGKVTVDIQGEVHWDDTDETLVQIEIIDDQATKY